MVISDNLKANWWEMEKSSSGMNNRLESSSKGEIDNGLDLLTSRNMQNSDGVDNEQK